MKEILIPYKYEIAGVLLGAAVGFIIPSAAEFFLQQASLPEGSLRLFHRVVQSPWTRGVTTTVGGFLGLVVGNAIGSMREFNENKGVSLAVDERGSVRVVAALTAGALAAGIGVGVLVAYGTEPVVNVIGGLSVQVGEAISRAPVISSRVDY